MTSVIRPLGELETRVMDVLWSEAPLSVRDVAGRLARLKLAYTTLMTTLDRLHKKGLLERTKDGNAFLYAPAMDRAAYQGRLVAAAVEPLLRDGAAPILAAFVDTAAGVDEENLARLEALIRERRRKR